MSKFKLFDLEMIYFLPIAAIISLALYLDKMPKGMIGAIPFLLVFGAILNELGNRLPIVKDYFGGGPIVAIFASAALVYYKIIPETQIETVSTFMKSGGFLDFYIAALIVGSILGMDKDLLVKASLKYLPVIIGGVSVALILTGVVGGLVGYGFNQALFFIAIPIMGGGMGAGAVPLSKIFGESMSQTPESLLSIMVPAVALGNAMSIVAAGILNRIGKKYKSLSGEGQLLKGTSNKSNEDKDKVLSLPNYNELGVGLLIATTFFVFGNLLSKFIPKIHPYALMIISVALAKVFGLLGTKYEEYATKWYQFIMKNFTSALLVGIGIAYTSLEQVIAAFSPTYLLLVFTTVIGCIIGTAIVGHLMGFYIIEGCITAGLCMANMGGTGDVAVMSAAKRMELMPFSQISSRIGGAFMLILTTFLLTLLN